MEPIIINNFFQNFNKKQDISRVLPHKKYATKLGPAYIMTITITEAHKRYQQTVPSHLKCSLGFFAAARPRNVRKIGTIHPATCICPKCANVG